MNMIGGQARADELVRYGTTDEEVWTYHLAGRILERQAKAVIKGKYDKAKAIKAWENLAKEAAREFGRQKGIGAREGLNYFPPLVRHQAAVIMEEAMRDEVVTRAESMIGPETLAVRAHSFGRDVNGNSTAHYDVDGVKQTKQRQQVGTDGFYMDGATHAIRAAGHEPDWYVMDPESAVIVDVGGKRASALFHRKAVEI